MREWQTWSGGAAWMLLATLMVSAALQPVEVSAAPVETVRLVAVCADGTSSLVMGCESIHL